MAGVKGRSGGARPGSGPKRKPPTVITPDVAGPQVDGGPFNPRPTLERIALGEIDVSPQQFKALMGLMPYTNAKKGEGGKKEQRQAAAEKVVRRFTPAAPPKLAAIGGKKVS